MATPKPELFTAGKIAQTLGASGTQVKRAIQDLKLKPLTKKGACSYYGMDALTKIKSAIK